MSTKTLFWALVVCVIAAIIFVFTVAAHAHSTSYDIGGRTMDEQIAVINGQNPSRTNDYGVGITNGYTGQRRRESAFERTTQDLCARAYPGDRLGQTLCRDNERRVRSDQYDRWMGIGQYRNDYAPRVDRE